MVYQAVILENKKTTDARNLIKYNKHSAGQTSMEREAVTILGWGPFIRTSYHLCSETRTADSR